MAHSWAGNLVTCQNWTHLWLNEGLTTYLEYNILQKIIGKNEFELEAFIGQYQLN